VFPSLPPFRYTQPSVSPTFGTRQHLTLSILAHFQNGVQQKTSNTNDERLSKFQLQRPSQKNSLHFFVTYFRHSYKLRTSQRQPSTRTHGRVYCGRSRSRASGPTRAAPGINEILSRYFLPNVLPVYNEMALKCSYFALITHNDKAMT